MAKIKLTPELLKKYFNNEKKYAFYVDACKEAEALNVHANKVYPKELIEGRRPAEGDEIHEYRKKIYKSMTKGPVQKVITELAKIRKSDDWSVLFKVETMSGIKKGQEPKTYWEKKFPKFRSLTNWAFTVLLRSMLLEANSVILVMPLKTKVQKGEYRKPFPFWFPTDCVIEMQEEELCILKSRDKCTYKQGVNTYTDGDIFYVVNDESITRYEQTSTTREFTAADTYEHGLGYMPAFKVGGQFLRAQEGYYLFESRISAMIDHLDEAAREYSDLQAEVVQHIHSQKWVLDTQGCQKCNNTGKVNPGGSGVIPCDQCKGTGSVATSPYLNIVIKRGKVGDLAWTGDPAGYVKKPVEIVDIQDKRIDKHLFRALASVNMEFLADVPLNESGKAKEVDRDALNTLVNSIAEDLVLNMDRVMKMGNDYMYKDIITDEEKRETLMADINVPTKYDILSTNYLVREVRELRDGKVNPLIINASEVELANKKFANNTDVRDRLIAIYELDPIPGIDDEAKIVRLQNKGVTIEDYVISCNIQKLVQMAFFKDKEFTKKPLDEKQKIIAELAKDKVAQAMKKMEINTDNPELDEFGNPIDPNADPSKKPVKKPEPAA